MVSFTRFATIMTTSNTKKLPILAATAKEASFRIVNEASPVTNDAPINSNAAPRLAPELMPKTKGPASGLRKSVCINRPLKDRPPPTKIAVNAFGMR